MIYYRFYEDQILPVDLNKPILEENTLEEECEDEIITVPPFSIGPNNEVIFSQIVLIYLISIILVNYEKSEKKKKIL